MYDDTDFADRFLYQLNVFGIRVLIGLSRLCHAHIAYETDVAKSSQNSTEFPIICMI